MANTNPSLPTTVQLPLTYVDCVCEDDVDPLAAETTSDLQNLEQDVLHLLLEAPGSNEDDPLRGIGIMNYLSGTVNDLQSLPRLIEEQLLQDTRISTVDCNIVATGTPAFPQFTISLVITCDATVIPLDYTLGPGGLTPQ